MLKPKPGASKEPRRANRRLLWLTGILIVSVVAVFLLRAVFNHLEEELQHRGTNERARLFIGEEIVRGIHNIEKDVYRMATTQNEAGFARVGKDVDLQLDKLMQDLNVLKFGGTIRQQIPLNLAEQEEYTREATYRPEENGRELIMELVEIGPQLGYVREQIDDLEQHLLQRWQAIESGDRGRFFTIEDEIAMLLKRMPPYFERLDENANRLFLDGDRRLRELEAELQGRRVVLKQIETGLIIAIIILGGIAGSMYLRRLGEALQRARVAGDEVEGQREQIVTMLDTLSDGVYATDLAGRITFINTAAERILDWPAAELIGHSAHEVLHHTRPNGEPYPKVACPLMSVTREGVPLDGEEHFITRDGRFVPVSFRSRPLRQQGRVTGYLVSFQDIGSQLEDQARIRLQQAALDAAVNMIVITNLEGIIEYVNPSFSRTTGYALEEAIGRKMNILRSGVHDADFYAAMWRDLVRGLPWEGEIINRRKDGSLYQEQMSITPIIEDGQVAHFVAVKRDVSEEAQTRTRLQLVEAAVREADQGILITDVDISEKGPRILYTNPAFSRITGYPAAAAIGQHMDVLHGADADPNKLKVIRDAVVAGASIVVDMDCRRMDGSPYVAELTYSPVRDEHGDIGHYIALLSDVSQRKAFEEALREARDQALDSVRMKSDFLSTMSHEIRTPMNGIIGMTDLLLDTNLDGEQREFASVVRDSAGSLLTIIDDILDFSKIEAGRLDIEHTEFSPVQIVEGATELLAAKAREKNIGLACYVDPALPSRMLGDPTRVRQVLLNLIGNAVKFTDRGEVVVTASVEHANKEPRAYFEVRDTGIGIAPETQGRLFQSFTQADSTTTRKYGGTGLGLAICKRLVELMGGRIGLVSSPGEGSRFWFSLPLTAFSDRGQSAAMQMLRYPGKPSGRALIVDHHPLARGLLARYLTAWGIECDVTDDCEEVRRLMQEGNRDQPHYQVVYIDAGMPGGDAMAFARTFFGVASAKAKPRLVLLTTFDRRDVIEEAIANGFSGCLVKPVRQSQLLESLSDTPVGLDDADATPVAESTIASSINLRDALERNRLLLLVEDNPTNQRVAQLQINKLGYAVHTVANGRDAVDAIEALPYAAILMDCQMPVMDGFEATAAIRRWERGHGSRRVPIIAMTANAMEGDRDKCILAGMDDYLSKPIDASALMDALTRWVGAGIGGEIARTTETTSTAVFDRSRLQNLLGDDADILHEVLGVFRSSTAELLVKIDASAESQDGTATRALAHEAKGSCANLGMDAMATTAAALERAALVSDWIQVDVLRRQLRTGFDEGCRLIDEFLKEIG
jgi:two-component system, sensor histidine kinase and response regulator